ncbi:MAG: hypothetical protein RLZZ200_623 [Pseudomonadota bacterium]|jgi:hypothetical protein
MHSLQNCTNRLAVLVCVAVFSCFSRGFVSLAESAPRTECLTAATAELTAAAGACSRDTDCARVADLYASCPKLLAWWQAVAPADGKTVSAFDLERGLARARSPYLAPSEASVRAQECSGAQFSDEHCRQFLGLAPLPAAQQAPDIASADERERLAALLGDPLVRGSNPGAGAYAEARRALAACEAARNDPNREGVCQQAQTRYEECRAARDSWAARRDALLKDIDARTPGVGQAWAGSALRGEPRAPQDEWGNRVRTARTLQLDGCPGLLPSSLLTPVQAMAEWKRQDAAAVRPVASGKGAAAGGKGGATGGKPAPGALTTSLFQQSVTNAQDPDAAAKFSAAQANTAARLAQTAQSAADFDRKINAGIATAFTGLITGAAGGGAGLPQAIPGYGGDPTVAGVLGALGGMAGGGSISIAPGASCKSAQDQAAAQFNATNSAAPANASTVQLIQVALWQIDESIRVLSSAACAGDSEAASLLQSMRASRESTMRTCRQVSNSESNCVARRNW